MPLTRAQREARLAAGSAGPWGKRKPPKAIPRDVHGRLLDESIKKHAPIWASIADHDKETKG